MFTGKYPSENGIINTRQDKLNYPTITEILSDNGYNTASYGGNPFIYSTPLKRGFDKIFDMDDILYLVSPLKRKKFSSDFLEDIYDGINTFLTSLKLDKDPTAWGTTSPSVREAMKKEIPKMEEPFFLYLHMTETHLICSPPLSFQKFGKKHLFFPQFLGDHFGVYSDWFKKKIMHWAGESEKGLTKKEIEIINDAYDNTLHHVDFQLRILYNFLEKNGLLDNTILIITADHGEMLGEEGQIAHMFSFAEPLINIPLIIKAPGIDSGVVEDLVEGKEMFNIILKLVKGENSDFWNPSDYVFGEWKAIPEQAERIEKINPNIYTEANYIRTKKAKYIEYNNGDEGLYRIDRKEEKIDNPQLKETMKKMLEIKKKSLQKRGNFKIS